MPSRLKAWSNRSLLGLVAVPLLALGACSDAKGDAAGGARAATVGYATVQAANVPIPVTLSGRVVAYQTSEVRPQVSGLIKRIYFKEGGYVKAGQPLFQIDSSLYRASVNQARANLESAEASASAAGAKAKRFEPLAKIGAVAEQDYTDAQASANQARAAVDQARAALDTARINLRFTTVPAPISGRIGRSLFTVGALVSSSQSDPLAVIQRTDPVYVDMQQSAAELTRFRQSLAAGGTAPGSATVTLTLDDGTRYPQTGRVQFSEVTVNQDTGTVTLRASFPNPKGVLLPGMFVNATFDQATDKNAFLVPQQAVHRDFNGSAFVYLVGSDGTALRRDITTDRTMGEDWVVTAGLKPGDKIITQAQDTLKSGAKIKAVPQDTPQMTGGPKGAQAGQGG